MSNNQPVALVTGASGGIGKSIAEALAANGYYVFAAARSMNKLEAMRTSNIEPLGLDVTDPAAIQAAVEQIMSAKGRIDALVNNAGYGLYGTIEGLTDEQVRRAFDVNVFGLGNVTRTVIPIMRQQESGTIVNISSNVGKVSSAILGWYAATKHAVEAMSDALRQELKPFGINVVIIEPGWIKTGFEDVAVRTLEQSDDPRCYDERVASFRKQIQNGYASASHPSVVSEAVLKAVASSNPKTRYAVGSQARLSITMRTLLTDRMFDWVVTQM